MGITVIDLFDNGDSHSSVRILAWFHNPNVFTREGDKLILFLFGVKFSQLFDLIGLLLDPFELLHEFLVLGIARSLLNVISQWDNFP